jgi:tetratricopeptide (TPR) repeat protein
MLDAEEYLALAVHASSVKDHHTCLTYLDEVLRQQPSNASALFLRAVQHAELGLTTRALRGLEAALEINPGLEVAGLAAKLRQLLGTFGKTQ